MDIGWFCLDLRQIHLSLGCYRIDLAQYTNLGLIFVDLI